MSMGPGNFASEEEIKAIGYRKGLKTCKERIATLEAELAEANNANLELLKLAAIKHKENDKLREALQTAFNATASENYIAAMRVMAKALKEQ